MRFVKVQLRIALKVTVVPIRTITKSKTGFDQSIIQESLGSCRILCFLMLVISVVQRTSGHSQSWIGSIIKKPLGMVRAREKMVMVKTSCQMELA